jgi:hypothetical protein
LIYKNLTKGIKLPMFGDDLPELENQDIQTAVENLAFVNRTS